MEKAKNVWVIPGDFGWSDLGSWNAVHDLGRKDKNNNVILANAIIGNSSECIIVGEKDKLIIMDGLKNYMVADFGNGLLICRKDDEKKIKDFVNRIAEEKGEGFI
jgi:mannose-1-phosphate guanylyltransferase